MKDKTKVRVIIIIAILLLIVMAMLFVGVDGVLLTSVVSVLAGLTVERKVKAGGE